MVLLLLLSMAHFTYGFNVDFLPMSVANWVLKPLATQVKRFSFGFTTRLNHFLGNRFIGLPALSLFTGRCAIIPFLKPE
jgi:hypothetical protein